MPFDQHLLISPLHHPCPQPWCLCLLSLHIPKTWPFLSTHGYRPDSTNLRETLTLTQRQVQSKASAKPPRFGSLPDWLATIRFWRTQMSRGCIHLWHRLSEKKKNLSSPWWVRDCHLSQLNPLFHEAFSPLCPPWPSPVIHSHSTWALTCPRPRPLSGRWGVQSYLTPLRTFQSNRGSPWLSFPQRQIFIETLH